MAYNPAMSNAALSRLSSKYALEIAAARRIAVRQCLERGTSHTQSVWDEMVERGLLSATGPKTHWMGAVFRCPLFTWTGLFYRSSHSGRGIHESKLYVWRLVEGADTSMYTVDEVVVPVSTSGDDESYWGRFND